MQLIKKTTIDFIGKRKVTFIISGIIAISRFNRNYPDRQKRRQYGDRFLRWDLCTTQFHAADFYGESTYCAGEQ